MATLHILKKEGIFTFVDKMAGIPVIPYPWDANMTVSKSFVEKWNSKSILASYWIEKLLHDVHENQGNIADNAGHIAHNADNIQEYFKDIMNFDAIRLVDNAFLGGLFGPIPPVIGAIVVQINGNEGYVCDTEGTVDQHTADLLCQKAGAAGATDFYTRCECSKINISLMNIEI